MDLPSRPPRDQDRQAAEDEAEVICVYRRASDHQPGTFYFCPLAIPISGDPP